MSDYLKNYVKKLEKRIEDLEKQNNIKKCGNCNNFYQHYILSDDKYQTVNCGHCATPRIKERKPDGLACKYWKAKPLNE